RCIWYAVGTCTCTLFLMMVKSVACFVIDKTNIHNIVTQSNAIWITRSHHLYVFCTVQERECSHSKHIVGMKARAVRYNTNLLFRHSNRVLFLRTYLWSGINFSPSQTTTEIMSAPTNAPTKPVTLK